MCGLILAALYLPKDESARSKPKLDAVGFLLLAPSIAGLIQGLTHAGRRGTFADAAVVVPSLVGFALLLAFCAHALRRDEPLVDIRLVKFRPMGSAAAVLFFNAFAIYGPLLLLPIYYIEGRGASALSAGVILMPEAIGTLLGFSIAGWVTDKLGARPAAVAATALVTLTTIPFIFVTAHTSGWLLAIFLLLRGLGLGAVGVPALAKAYQGLDRSQVGHATVLTRTVVQIGGSFGTAILAVILVRATAARAGDIVAAVNAAFAWSVGFGAVAVLLAFWLPGRRPLH